ncbi:MAG: IS110 family transposase [Azospirillum sp.]|nr:IS110 family transposase [Azospirillum sp.]
MGEVSIVGLDLAKNVFQVHGASACGAVVFRKQLRRNRVLGFFGELGRCVVAMEACASSHYWGREITKLGHEVRLIAPIYVKPFVKRQKSDVADAEAIAEAAIRPTMRFVAVKSESQQAAGMTFRARDLLVRQRTQTINALRGHLAEFGVTVPTGAVHVGKLIGIVRDPNCSLPKQVIDVAVLLVAQVEDLNSKIATLMEEITRSAHADEVAKRLMTIPGVGPITAAAILALAPPAQTFGRGRDFSAWLGLVPRQFSSGGKERLGSVSKAGQRDIRRLLITGCMSVVRWATRRSAPEVSWLTDMLGRKPRMLVAVALTNRTARIAWALMAKGGTYRHPAAAV